MEYYRAKPGMSIKDFVTRWQAGDKAFDDSFPIMMDAGELWKYRDYTRTPEFTKAGFSWPYYSDEGDHERETKGYKTGQEKWGAMVQSMGKYGWDEREPLHLYVGQDGKAKVGEGNHRLAIWLQAGKTEVPVIVHFVTTVSQTWPQPPYSYKPRMVEGFKFFFTRFDKQTTLLSPKRRENPYQF